MTHYALTAVGPDRPGILAALTEPLVRHKCNLEDTSATILRGHFMLMMVVGLPEGVEIESVLSEVRARCDAFEIRVEARQLRPLEGPPAATHVVSLYGADKPGIVFRLAEVLARHGVNMLELDSRLVGRPGRPIYAMLLEIAVPDESDEAGLLRDVEALGAELGVDVSLRPIEAR